MTSRGVKRPVDRQPGDAERWTQARLAGVTVARIAHDEGVSCATVSRATSTRMPDRGQHHHVPSPAEVRQWAAQRRERVSVADLARQSGASAVTIRRATQNLGPFPRPRRSRTPPSAPSPPGGASRLPDGTLLDAGTVCQWVQARQAGTSIVQIARNYAISPDAVARATTPYGPFPTPQRAPAGHLTSRQLADRLGISRSALRRRLDKGDLPEPAGHHRNGWPYWRATDIEAWIATLQLARCPTCGAYLKRLAWHTISRHHRPAPQQSASTRSPAPDRHPRPLTKQALSGAPDLPWLRPPSTSCLSTTARPAPRERCVTPPRSGHLTPPPAGHGGLPAADERSCRRQCVA